MTPISADDYTQLLNLMGAYCHHIDGGEAEKWADCFTPDGVFEGPGMPAPVQGRAALIGFARAIYGRSNGGRMRHMAGNLTCGYGTSRDEVKARLYNYVTTWDVGGQSAIMALCDVDFRRTPDGWRIARNAHERLG